MLVHGLSCVFALILLLPKFRYGLPQQKNVHKQYLNEVNDFKDIVEKLDESVAQKRSINSNTAEFAKRSNKNKLLSTYPSDIQYESSSSVSPHSVSSLTDKVDLYNIPLDISFSEYDRKLEASTNLYHSENLYSNSGLATFNSIQTPIKVNTDAVTTDVSASTESSNTNAIKREKNNMFMPYTTEVINPTFGKVNKNYLHKRNKHVSMKNKKERLDNKFNRKIKGRYKLTGGKNHEEVNIVEIPKTEKEPIIFVLEPSRKNVDEGLGKDLGVDANDLDYVNYENVYEDAPESMSQIVFLDNSVIPANERRKVEQVNRDVETDYPARINDEKPPFTKRKFGIDPDRVMSEKLQEYSDFYRVAKEYDGKLNAYILKQMHPSYNTKDYKWIRLDPIEFDYNADDSLRRFKRFINNIPSKNPGNEVSLLRNLLTALQSNTLQQQNLTSVPVLFMTIPSEKGKSLTADEKSYPVRLSRTQHSSDIFSADKDVSLAEQNNHLMPGILVYPRDANAQPFLGDYDATKKFHLNSHVIVKKEVTQAENNNKNSINKIMPSVINDDKTHINIAEISGDENKKLVNFESESIVERDDDKGSTQKCTSSTQSSCSTTVGTTTECTEEPTTSTTECPTTTACTTETTEPTTQCTEATTQCTEATTQCTEATTQCTEATTQCTEATTQCTEATTEDTTQCTETTTECTEATTECAETTTECTEATTQCTETTTECAEATTQCTQATTQCTEVTTQCTEGTTECTEATTECTEATTECTEATTECTEATTECTESPTTECEEETTACTKKSVTKCTTESRCTEETTDGESKDNTEATDDNEEPCSCECPEDKSNPHSRVADRVLFKKISKLEEDLKLVHEVQNILDGMNEKSNFRKRNLKEVGKDASDGDIHKSRNLLSYSDLNLSERGSKRQSIKKYLNNYKGFKKRKRRKRKVKNNQVDRNVEDLNRKKFFLGVRQPNFS